VTTSMVAGGSGAKTFWRGTRKQGGGVGTKVSPWESSAELLTEYGSLSATELAHLAGIHPGNARKYLAILAKQGRAQRLPDGQWIPTAFEHHGAA
jgi:hypothetical protein